MTRLAAVFAVGAALLPAPVHAWAELGHRLVGELAGEHLNPQARAEVRRLLAGEADPTLAGVATWADALRASDPARFRATSAWHYINARGGGCRFNVARDCPQGNCVVAAIEAQARLLADRSQASAVRRDALKFLVHLVADVHQPLHAGSRTDSGGNRFQIRLTTSLAPEEYARSGYRDGVMATNLHAVWDYYVLASAGLTRVQYVQRLRSRLPAQAGAGTSLSPLQWARESCALVDAERIYPPARAIDHRYLDTQRPLAERRILTAAARLAALLNEALAPR